MLFVFNFFKMISEISLVFLSLSVILLNCGYVSGHGYLLDPPARTSLWRDGYNVILNVDDNNMACGGKEVQWGINGGKCGYCGDRYDGPRHSEAGGKYATGIISRSYQQGQILPITVVLTAAHGGWFEFRICPNNNIYKPITQECLDMYLLKSVKDPNPTRFTNVTTGGGYQGNSVYQLEYLLPEGLICEQCVLQWVYNTGKDWGCDETTKLCALGLGPQEQFYGCADIAITGDGNTPRTRRPTLPSTKVTETPRTTTTTMKPTTTQPPKTTSFPKSTTTTAKPSRTSAKTTSVSTTTTPVKPKTTHSRDNVRKEPCVAKGVFRGSVMDNRCRYLCQMGTCPQLMCADACRKLSPN